MIIVSFDERLPNLIVNLLLGILGNAKSSDNAQHHKRNNVHSY